MPKLSCDSRNKGCNVSYYHVNDTTNIEKLSLKEFLSNEKTKRELTTYLSTKFVSHFSNVVDECYAIENNKLISSKSHNPILSFNNHDEADTLLIWFSIYCKAKYGTNITIELICSDTDVVLLCLNYAMKLPDKTLLCTIFRLFLHWCIERSYWRSEM